MRGVWEGFSERFRTFYQGGDADWSVFAWATRSGEGCVVEWWEVLDLDLDLVMQRRSE